MHKALTVLIFAILLATASTAAFGQFKIKVPKLPKVTKQVPKADQEPSSDDSTAKQAPDTKTSVSAETKPAVATEPYLTLNSMFIKAFATSGKGSTVWLPDMKFVINGPVASGDRLRVEYDYPGMKAPMWCEPYTKPLNSGQWLSLECDGRSYDTALGSTYTGPVKFSIKLFNELAGTNKVIFTGSFNVAKGKERGASKPGNFAYWVDYDWNLPLGYVFLTQDSVYGARRTKLNVSYWTRGTDHIGAMDPHIFYQGKEITSQNHCEEQITIEPTLYADDSIKPTPTWKRFYCEFYQIFGTNATNEGISGQTHAMDKNPGEYEFKLLRNGRLARSIKFTVKPDGSINGIPAAKSLGTWWTAVPVTVIGDQDGAYDKNAYKTKAFWGHPLPGFVAN